jgi:hypothetical protein
MNQPCISGQDQFSARDFGLYSRRARMRFEPPDNRVLISMTDRFNQSFILYLMAEVGYTELERYLRGATRQETI